MSLYYELLTCPELDCRLATWNLVDISVETNCSLGEPRKLIRALSTANKELAYTIEPFIE